MSDISIAGYWLVLSTLKNYSLVCLNLNHEVEYAANQWTRNSSTIEEEFPHFYCCSSELLKVSVNYAEVNHL